MKEVVQYNCCFTCLYVFYSKVLCNICYGHAPGLGNGGWAIKVNELVCSPVHFLPYAWVQLTACKGNSQNVSAGDSKATLELLNPLPSKPQDALKNAYIISDIFTNLVNIKNILKYFLLFLHRFYKQIVSLYACPQLIHVHVYVYSI